MNTHPNRTPRPGRAGPSGRVHRLSLWLAVLMLPAGVWAQTGREAASLEALLEEPPPYHFQVAGHAGMHGMLDMGAGGANQWIINLADPVYARDAATKAYVDNADIAGNAATATALAANGSNCAAGQYARGVDAQGNAEGCSADISGTAATATALAANGSNCAAGQYARGVDTTGNAEQCSADATNDSVSSNELDALCATNGKILKRSGGLWDCADDAVGSGDNLGDHTALENIKLNGHWLSADDDPEGVYVATDGKVGIGESAPSGNLHVGGIDGVLFEGTYGTGTIPAQGDGTRFMWYPRYAALRAGEAVGAEWDEGTPVTGKLSVTSGSDILAGSGTLFSGELRPGYRVQVGSWLFTIASVVNDTEAILTQPADPTLSGTAVLRNIGRASTAMGNSTTASGSYSTALGASTTASGEHSTALGNSTTASGYNSTALGITTTASGAHSTAMGSQTKARSLYETVVGSYNTDYSGSPSFWVATDRLFVIGNGQLGSPASDAMVVLKNGNVGLGDSAPDERLVVAGNVVASSPTAADHLATKAYVDNADIAGTAATAWALAANGTNCPAGQYARGVDAQGNAEGCTVDSVNDSVSSNELDALCATNGKILKRSGGVWNCADDAVGSGDNLGNHIATENLQLSGYWLSGDGGPEGVYVATDGSVGVGISNPQHRLHVLDDEVGLSYPLKLDNPHSGVGETAVGVLFSVEGHGADRGKGAIAYQSTGNWNRGSFHFLQDVDDNPDNPDLDDAVMTIANNGSLDVKNLTRIRGNTWPAAGTGGSLELAYDSAVNRGYVQAYDRNTGAYGDLRLVAATITRQPAAEGILRIPPAAFEEIESGWTLETRWTLSSHGEAAHCSDPDLNNEFCAATAPVYLPNGATVTRLVAYFYNNTEYLITRAKLRWSNPYLGDAGEMADAWVSAMPGERQIASDDTIDAATIRLFDRQYLVTVALPPGGASVGEFYGVMIEYEYTGFGP